MRKSNFGNFLVDERDDPSAGLTGEEKAVNRSKHPQLTRAFDKADANREAVQKLKRKRLAASRGPQPPKPRTVLPASAFPNHPLLREMLLASCNVIPEGHVVRSYKPIPGRGGPDYEVNKLARRAEQRLEKKAGETPEKIKERKDRDAERKFLKRIQKEIEEKGLTGAAAQEFMNMRHATRAWKRQLR